MKGKKEKKGYEKLKHTLARALAATAIAASTPSLHLEMLVVADFVVVKRIVVLEFGS
jgi:hypothetical protein